ncbi:Nudix hydrolase 9 [Hordeum vulgare]|nr:Nudix hydrolase 9 [Hordeum vulgare]
MFLEVREMNDQDCTHVSCTDTRFDLEEHLTSATADLDQDLAHMKCPNNYPLGLTKVTMGDGFVCRRGTYISGANPRFDPFCVWGNEIFMNKHQMTGVEETKVKVYNSYQHDNSLEFFLKAVNDGQAIITRGWTKVVRAYGMHEGTLWAFSFFNTINSHNGLHLSLHLYIL